MILHLRGGEWESVLSASLLNIHLEPYRSHSSD